MHYQNAILEPVPTVARFMEFSLLNAAKARTVLLNLAGSFSAQDVIGIGKPLLNALDIQRDSVCEFPTLSNAKVPIPCTQKDLWVWVRADDAGAVFKRAQAVRTALAPAFAVVDQTNAFCFEGGRDLTGYEDGTENPVGDDAVAAAFDKSGGSFVAVQRWHHDFEQFNALSLSDRDNTIGRRIVDNVEFDDAPISAHVKRTAQESFEPEAFVVRRSMPWSDGRGDGLVFLAFGHSHASFEAQLRRMVGLDDGIVDALFSISTPLTGAYYWCPPRDGGGLDFGILD